MGWWGVEAKAGTARGAVDIRARAGGRDSAGYRLRLRRRRRRGKG